MGDDFWNTPPPRGPKARRNPPATAPADAWGTPAAKDEPARRVLRPPWRYTLQTLAGLGVSVALVMAAFSLAEGRAETLDLSSGAGLRPVVAAVPLAPGQTPDQLCRDYDIPVQLCELSRDCRGALQAAPGSNGGAVIRSEHLILRSTEESCGKTVAQLRRQSNRP